MLKLRGGRFDFISGKTEDLPGFFSEKFLPKKLTVFGRSGFLYTVRFIHKEITYSFLNIPSNVKIYELLEILDQHGINFHKETFLYQDLVVLDSWSIGRFTTAVDTRLYIF